MNTLEYILIAAFFIFLILFVIIYAITYSKNNDTNGISQDSDSTEVTCVYPNGDKSDIDMRNWKWDDLCRGKTNFILKKSEWPSYLTYKAWDSCQGCKSAGYGPDISADSFQVIGDWMRISQRNGNSVSVVSGSNSKQHWFNPPRNDTDDQPLLMEWYMNLDAKEWGTTPEEIYASGLTDTNWSAFWAFGHGTGQYSWPRGGEWDLAEWLPTFGEGAGGGKGLASGFHNAVSGSFPPCGLKRDGIMYPLDPNIPIDASEAQNGSGFLWPGQAQGRGFSNWGVNLDKNNPTDFNRADSVTYNNIIHCFLRCTTKQVTIWAKTNSDPSLEPSVNIKENSPEISNDEFGQSFKENGYTPVFNTYCDFGSNHDMTFANAFPNQAGQEGTANAPTNWHQNLFFVWSVILSRQGSRASQDIFKPLTFYLSDIRLQGGGNYRKAMAPLGVIEPNEILKATETSDFTASTACPWIGNSDETNRCNNRLVKNASDQFKKCQS